MWNIDDRITFIIFPSHLDSQDLLPRIAANKHKHPQFYKLPDLSTQSFNTLKIDSACIGNSITLPDLNRL